MWIFASHSLYPALLHQRELVHLTALFDQRLVGFVAKLSAYLPMWVVAFTIFSRADEWGTPVEEKRLHWADVERKMLRADRARARTQRRRFRRD